MESTSTWAWERAGEAEVKTELGGPAHRTLHSYGRVASMLGAGLLYARLWSKYFYVKKKVLSFSDKAQIG